MKASDGDAFRYFSIRKLAAIINNHQSELSHFSRCQAV